MAHLDRGPRSTHALLLTLALVGCSSDDTATSDTAGSTGASSISTSSTSASTATTSNTMGATVGETSGGGSDSATSGSTGGTTSGTTSGTTTTAGTTDPGTSTDATMTGVTATDTGSSSTTGPEPCAEGTILCEGNVAQTCDGMGGFSSQEDCGDDVCVADLGCVLCVPGEGSCEGSIAKVCNDQGDGWIEESCDTLQGLACNADLGVCDGSCSKAALGLSYIGCDYYPTVLPQHDSYNQGGHQYAVTVSNTTGQSAKITVTRGGNTVLTDNVAANSVKALTLPWVNETTKGTGPSKVVPGGAYRLRSDQPVTVYQYNPIAATTTNDASLLLPVNAWTGNYLISAWKQWSGYPGFYAVVAAEDGTTVNLTPSTTGGSVSAGGGVQANGTGQAMLNAGDVLVVFSTAGDLTGTIVAADKPIEAFGGHKCTQVPPGACDHLEEAMLPIEALAKEYLVAPTAQFPNPALDKPQVIKIIASEDNTVLTYEPDQPVAKNLAKAGDFVEIAATTAHFKVSADKKISVVQYMVGQSAQTGQSDPAFVQAIPTDQFRTDYLIHAPTSWQANFVDIIAPDGAMVTVDGVAVGAFKPIGNSGFSIAHVQLANNGNGNHAVSSNEKVGLSVYGVQSYGSYWYPGGTDLVVIPQ